MKVHNKHHVFVNREFSSLRRPLEDFKPIALNYLHKGYRFVWQNGKFDTKFLKEHLDLTLPISHDIMYLCYVQSTIGQLRTKGWLSLKNMAPRILGVEDWDVDLSDKTKVTEESIDYLIKDVEYTDQVFLALKKSMDKEDNLTYRLLCKSAEVYRDIELNGIYIDIEKAKRMYAKYERLSEEALEDLKKHADINYNSPKQLQKLLFDDLKLPIQEYTDSGQPSTNKLTLTKLATMHPIAKKILKMRDATKALGFIKDWIDRAIDSRIYPNFHLASTITGRTSSSKPNIQQVPRNKDLKSLFTAPEGWKFVQVDFSQMELRMAAIVAGVSELKRLYKAGEDVHENMAKSILNKDSVTKQERSIAKPVNFGFLYGMSYKAFPDYALVSYGQEFTQHQAQQIKNTYMSQYEELPLYYETVDGLLMEQSFLDTLFGRRYKIDWADFPTNQDRNALSRQARNAGVQTPANDYALLALIENHEQSFDNVRIVATVHDSVLLEIKDDERMLPTLRKIKDIMEKPKYVNKYLKLLDRKPLDIPIVADVELGPWGMGEEIQFKEEPS